MTTDPSIKVAGLSKQYILGARQGPAPTYREMLVALLQAPLRRFAQLRGQVQRDQTFLALRDVTFSVAQGEVVGIVGRNGAGKSTLLKVLSRITEPTGGRVELRGRVASLLEVGTGFHPELSGRENIFLNGAILGMSRREIERKFDEIVGFAEVDRFIDTPIKRYSSGMYVRLAFAVAASLEAEILLVDEVLSVGDHEFQKKCLGRMEDIAGTGRTVLFVSHNMAAVRALCSRGLLLDAGRLVMDDDIEPVVDHYLGQHTAGDGSFDWQPVLMDEQSKVALCRAWVENESGAVTASCHASQGFAIVLEYEVLKPVQGLRSGFVLSSAQGIELCGSTDYGAWTDRSRPPGRYVSRCRFPPNLLNSGRYQVLFGIDEPPYLQQLIRTDACLNFQVEDLHGHGPMKQRLPGVLRPALEWEVDGLRPQQAKTCSTA